MLRDTAHQRELPTQLFNPFPRKCDFGMMDEINFNIPSGVALPLLLQKKLYQEQASQCDDDACKKMEPNTASVPPELANRTFTSEELEERIWRTSVALVDIQKQIHRGEEIYYEETLPRGSLFKGWDAFIDAKDVTGSSATPPVGGGSRRVPSDCRWFSGSCRSVSRNARPAPITTSTRLYVNTTTPSVRSNSTTPTQSVADVVSTRSEANTTTSVADGSGRLSTSEKKIQQMSTTHSVASEKSSGNLASPVEREKKPISGTTKTMKSLSAQTGENTTKPSVAMKAASSLGSSDKVSEIPKLTSGKKEGGASSAGRGRKRKVGESQ